MDFTEAVQLVLAKVKRPDKLILARAEVNNAVMLFTAQMDHPRDLVEGVHTASLADYTHTLPLADLPRYRKMDWLRYPGTRAYVSPLDNRVLGCTDDIRDKYYLAGNSLKVNLAKPTASLEYSYYAWPPTLTDLSPNHWQFEGNYPAIVAKAASMLFVDIGDAESAARAEKEAAVLFLAFQGDFTRGS